MPSVCRIGDPLACGDTAKSGSGNVYANGIPVTRLTDGTTGHGCWPPTINSSGSGNVYANGLPICRVGDSILAHTCSSIPETHGSTYASGSPNVTAN